MSMSFPRVALKNGAPLGKLCVFETAASSPGVRLWSLFSAYMHSTEHSPAFYGSPQQLYVEVLFILFGFVEGQVGKVSREQEQASTQSRQSDPMSAS